LIGSIPSTIEKLTNLKILSLYGNQLNGSIPISIGKLTSLEWLWLYSNNLTGSIPKEIGNLANLIRLDLYKNQLNGTIPSSIGNLTKLTHFYLYENRLSGPIPTSIGKLTSLLYLDSSHNLLSGSIPLEIRNLVKVRWLIVNDNQGLNGSFTPQCSIETMIALNTNVTICGCAVRGSPAVFFPPSGTPDECLASGLATSLIKRTQIFSAPIGTYKYTCNLDSNGNPFQDCLNTMAKICHPDYMGTNSTLIRMCKDNVNSMVKSTTQPMNVYWQNVRKECGQWKWTDGTIGNIDSTKCFDANLELQKNAYYVVPSEDGTGTVNIPVPSALTYSINKGLWSNLALKE